MLPSHVVHNHNIALSWPTTQPKMAVMIIFVEYESTVYMAFVTKVFVKVTLSFLLCGICIHAGVLVCESMCIEIKLKFLITECSDW